MLEKYREKRDFGRTPEPPPEEARGDEGALTFVVQKHAARQLHYDFRDEANRRIREGLAKGKLSFVLRGQKLRGSWTLVKTRRGENEWLLIKHHDRFEDSERDILEEEASVLSG